MQAGRLLECMPPLTAGRYYTQEEHVEADSGDGEHYAASHYA
jgi:hypothetical protein